MKKIIFTLLALVGTMSMNAQVLKVMKGDQVVATFSAGEADNFVFEEAPAFPFGQGEEAATGIGKVRWVQLWENGPKFAEYNVGATSATEYGGHYCWGKTIDKDEDDKFKDGESVLIGNDDTATALWGEKWRMPTKEEFDNLLKNCTVKWINGSTEKYNNTTVKGLLCTGKDVYSSNSVFLPAAGGCDKGSVSGQGSYGHYWSSTHRGSGSYYAYYLDFRSGSQCVDYTYRDYGYSVRAVLNETK